MSEEQASKLRDLRADDDWIQRNKAIASEEETLKREINLKLFQITPENYDDVLRECEKYCKTIEQCEIFVNILIDKAWV